MGRKYTFKEPSHKTPTKIKTPLNTLRILRVFDAYLTRSAGVLAAFNPRSPRVVT